MPVFGKASRERLETCHPDLIVIFNEVIKVFDCTISEGHRGEQAQNEAYKNGYSQVKWPNGNHNKYPSYAVDAYPYPVSLNPKNKAEEAIYIQRMCYFAGWVMGIADKLYDQYKVSNRLRWGADWNGDTEIKDHSFRDYPHFQLIIP